jgi:post-segregation antitoxin (ccd killing protein)
MKNITLSVEEDVLERARKVAADRHTTINALVRNYLRELAAQRENLNEALKRMNRLADEAGMEIGPVTWSRDDIHER